MPSLRDIQQGRYAVPLQRMDKAMTDKPEVFVVSLNVPKPPSINVYMTGAGVMPVRFVQDTKVIRLTDYEAARAADKARIGVLERELTETQGISRDEELRAIGYSIQLAETKARIAELEAENEGVKGMLNDAVVDVQALCPDCKNSWLFRHRQDRPFMHEYQQERNELLGLLRASKELAEFWINRGSAPGMTQTEYNVWLALGHQSNAMNAIRATLAKHGETK